MSLKTAIRAAQLDLPISRRHERWLTEHGANPVWSDAALVFAEAQLRSQVGGNRNRARMFRSSSAGSCERRQIFRILRFPEIMEIEGRTANIFATGNFIHLKWQMMGLTAGWMSAAEVSIERPDLNAGGTLDGISDMNTGVEVKSIHTRGYSTVMTYGPQDGHIFQVDHYMHLTDLEMFSIIYEDKNSQEWREYRVEKDDVRDATVGKTLQRLNNYLADEQLPRMLTSCEAQEGTEYRQCPFRKICPKAKWPQ